jgi:hypothetical protein
VVGVRVSACIRLVAAALLAASISAPVHAADAREAELTVDAFHEALKLGRAQVALSFLDRGVDVYEDGNVERTAAEYATSHLRADMEFAAAVTRAMLGRASGRVGDLAWVTTRGRVTGRFRDKAVDSFTTETMILRRDLRDNWRIVHIHWSSRPVPPD